MVRVLVSVVFKKLNVNVIQVMMVFTAECARLIAPQVKTNCHLAVEMNFLHLVYDVE